MNYFVAVDLGASSVRIVLVTIESQGVFFEEIHRFKNASMNIDGIEYWNIHSIFQEIMVGLSKVKKQGVGKIFLGIDSWAVDYCLVDKNGKLLRNPISYRDDRTKGTIDKFTEKMNKKKIYQKTGIQFLDFNTLYQLEEEDKDLLDKTSKIMMIPDYLNYLLTEKIFGEMTNASTTQLVNIETKKYDQKLLSLLNISDNKFPEIIEPGTYIGKARKDLIKHYNLPDISVIAVGSHDTASAIAGIPAIHDNWAFLSSGTWSLIGVENFEPITTTEAYEKNYTNEKGVEDTYRFLKNITGMWCIQEIVRILNYKYTYKELAEMAATVEPYQQKINLNDPRFMKPVNMIEEIQQACRDGNQKVPETIKEVVMCVYSNLAYSYATEVNNIQQITGKKIDTLHIVGGGANVSLLNQMTADLTNKKVIVGSTEATAIGNILVQMISSGKFEDLKEARSWLYKNLELEEYTPNQ